MRCLALAGELERLGFACRFATDPGSGATVPALAGTVGFEVSGGPAAEPAALREAWPEGVALLVADHYHRDAGFERACRPWAGRIAVIDDLADRPHDADLLLDPTPSRRPGEYRGLVPPACRLLLGPGYALLRSGFARAREETGRGAWPPNPPTRTVTALDPPRVMGSKGQWPLAGSGQSPGGGQGAKPPLPPCRLLVAFGATDPDNQTGQVLAGLAATGLELPVTVLLGGAAGHLEAVQATAARLAGPARVMVDVAGPWTLLAATDLAVGAVGTSAWERCCLGVPTVMVVADPDHHRIAAALSEAGAALAIPAGAGWPATVAAAVSRLAGDPEQRQAMAGAALAVCDGLGAVRAAAALAALVAAALVAAAP
jgi:spore coat polysaccharide biosynthesis predicted glycosyltransferase SpsG